MAKDPKKETKEYEAAEEDVDPGIHKKVDAIMKKGKSGFVALAKRK